MQVFIMRHGQAESLARRDIDRQLTHVGHAEAARVGSWMARQLPQIEQAWLSPYVRAQQTFSAVKSALQLTDKQSSNQPLLVPHGSAEMIAETIWDLAYAQPDSSLLVISHMPVVAFLVEALDDANNAPIFFPAAIAQLTLNPDTTQGKLDWIKAPHELF